MRGKKSWEFPAGPPRRAWRTGRVATSLVLASLFFAGAALTAGAGNETATPDDTTTLAATTTVTEQAAPEAPVVDTSSDAAPAATAATAPAPEPAPAEAPPASEPAPAPEAAPASEPAPVDPAPAAAPATEAAAPAAEATTAPAASTDATPSVGATTVEAPSATVEPSPAATPRAHHTRSSQRHVAKPAPRPLPVPVAAAPAFYPAAPFDLKAWVHDNPASPVGATAVAIATHYLGTPYVWGGSSPTFGFDCSGFTMFVYAQLGIALPHYAASQFAAFAKLDASQLEPGDLVFFEPRADGPGHVAIYIGNDTIVEAPHTGALVRIGSLSGTAAALGFLGAVRPYGTHPSTTPRAAFVSGAAHALAGRRTTA